jgi:RND family efflux transporter MFP subunit
MSAHGTPSVQGAPPGGESTRTGGRTALTIGITVVVVAALLLVAGILPRLERQRKLQAQAGDVSGPPVVTVARPRLGAASNALTLPGTLYGLHEAALYARVNGYVSRIDVDMGASVRAGQTLAIIDMPEVEQELQAARATVEQGEASGALARATLSRWRSMVDQTAATRQEFEEKQAAFNVSEASVKAARANVARLTALRRFGTIVAPFSGVVTARNVDVGALVAPGSGSTVRPLFTLAQVDRLRVLTSVPQNAAPTVRVGQEAEVLVQELGDVAFRGRVTRTSGALDYATRTLQTEIQLDNRDGRLLPGMFAQVKLDLPRGSRTLLIPANTLIVRAEGPQVAIVRDGKIVITPVTLGRDFGSELEVLGGVTEHDALVVNPGDDAPHGATVRVVQPVVPADSAVAR